MSPRSGPSSSVRSRTAASEMALSDVHRRLADALDGSVRMLEPLSRHTTYRVGGPAALWIEADSISDLAASLEILGEEGIEWVVLGKGSNILASDAGYEGAVIVLGRQFRRHDVDGERLRSGAGAPLAAIVQDAFRHGLAGFEFAVGIPGTVGGALAMNAGSRDEWIGTVVESVTLFSPGEGLRALGASEIRWGYRRTDLPQHGIIVEGTFRLRRDDVARIRRVMEASLSRRRHSQPLTLPSAGSVFANPQGDSAGRLIESLGLKGTRIGDACISDVHANFIVNLGGASASDIAQLVKLARDRVEEAYGTRLTPEIRFLGTFDEA